MREERAGTYPETNKRCTSQELTLSQLQINRLRVDSPDRCIRNIAGYALQQTILDGRRESIRIGTRYSLNSVVVLNHRLLRSEDSLQIVQVLADICDLINIIDRDKIYSPFIIYVT